MILAFVFSNLIFQEGVKIKTRKTQIIDKYIPIRGCTVLNDFDFYKISNMGCNYVLTLLKQM